MGRIDYENIYEKIYALGYQHPDNWRNSPSYNALDYLVSFYAFNTVLDVGCAGGRFVRRFRELGKKAYGIDISETAIRIATELGITQCKFGNILDIPYSSNQFDAVFTTDTLEHLHPDDVEQAIKELSRISKRYIFAHISDKPEANRRWINLLHHMHKDLLEYDDLHLSIESSEDWKIKIEKIAKVHLVEELDNHMMVFEKKA